MIRGTRLEREAQSNRWPNSDPFIQGTCGVQLEKQGTTYVRTYTQGNAQVRMNSEYPMMDGIGSERTVTNGTQAVQGTIMFEGFGQTISSTGSSANPYMFAATSGYRSDGDAGLMHVGARYYDAQVGRFITRDTFLTQHPYLYCEHNPVNATDPTGHILVLAVVIIGAYLLVRSQEPAGEPGDYTPDWTPVDGLIEGTLVGTLTATGLGVVFGGIGLGIATISGVVGGVTDYAVSSKDPTITDGLQAGALGGIAGGIIGKLLPSAEKLVKVILRLLR